VFTTLPIGSSGMIISRDLGLNRTIVDVADTVAIKGDRVALSTKVVVEVEAFEGLTVVEVEPMTFGTVVLVFLDESRTAFPVVFSNSCVVVNVTVDVVGLEVDVTAIIIG
jgi:hypothetical protein